jgi:hypothetical protein
MVLLRRKATTIALTFSMPCYHRLRLSMSIVGFVEPSRRDKDAQAPNAYHDILGLDHESYVTPRKHLFCSDPIAS